MGPTVLLPDPTTSAQVHAVMSKVDQNLDEKFLKLDLLGLEEYNI